MGYGYSVVGNGGGGEYKAVGGRRGEHRRGWRGVQHCTTADVCRWQSQGTTARQSGPGTVCTPTEVPVDVCTGWDLCDLMPPQRTSPLCRAVLRGRKEEIQNCSFAKRPRVAHMFNHGWW